MNYEVTRHVGDHMESKEFEGTPEEIAKLINLMDEKKVTKKHVPVIPKAIRMNPIKTLSHKVEDYTQCSCGDKNCDLWKLNNLKGGE